MSKNADEKLTIDRSDFEDNRSVAAHYFLKNQVRMKKLAQLQYDQKRDIVFFTYLDRLLNSAAIVAKEVRGTGPMMLDQFILGAETIAVAQKMRRFTNRMEAHKLSRGGEVVDYKEPLPE